MVATVYLAVFQRISHEMHVRNKMKMHVHTKLKFFIPTLSENACSHQTESFPPTLSENARSHQTEMFIPKLSEMHVHTALSEMHF